MKSTSALSLLASLLLFAACAATLTAAAPPGPQGPPNGPPNGLQNNGFGQGRAPRTPFTLVGKILSLNLTPRGDVEGIILVNSAGGIAQVNLPFELADKIKKLPIGEQVEVAAFPDNGPQDGRGP